MLIENNNFQITILISKISKNSTIYMIYLALITGRKILLRRFPPFILQYHPSSGERHYSTSSPSTSSSTTALTYVSFRRSPFLFGRSFPFFIIIFYLKQNADDFEFINNLHTLRSYCYVSDLLPHFGGWGA